MDTFTPAGECLTASFVNLNVDMAQQYRVPGAGGDIWLGCYSYDQRGVLRDYEGIPQTAPGSITPLGFVELHEDAQAIHFAASVACGIAATAWAVVSGNPTPAERDAILYLTLEACPRHSEDELAATFGVAPHEVTAAKKRIGERLGEPEFASQYAAARAIMHSACAYFPWYRGDGIVPF